MDEQVDMFAVIRRVHDKGFYTALTSDMSKNPDVYTLEAYVAFLGSEVRRLERDMVDRCKSCIMSNIREAED